MEATIISVLWKVMPRNTLLLTFNNAVMIIYEKCHCYRFFQNLLSALMTLNEGHWNWYAPKGCTKGYHCARFHGCSDHNVREIADVFNDFPPALMTITLDEGHKIWNDQIGPATKYLCARFHNCSGHSVWENVNVWVFSRYSNNPCGHGLEWRSLKLVWFEGR